MKVAVKDLRPNPFRHIERYPIIPEKVEVLMASIKDTHLWRNMEARKNDGFYEIPYGYHTLDLLLSIAT